VLATTNGELDVLLALALQTNLPELPLNFFHHAAHRRQVASNSLLNGHGLCDVDQIQAAHHLLFVHDRGRNRRNPLFIAKAFTGFSYFQGQPITVGLTAAQIEHWQALLGTRFIEVLADIQLKVAIDVSSGVIRVGDSTGRLKDWFARGSASIALVRPDRFFAGLAIP